MCFTYLSLLDPTFDIGGLLGYTPNLRSLHFKSLSNIEHPTIVSSICALNGSIFPLQYLTIDLTIHSDYVGPWAQWAAMDKLFEEQKFPLLERVIFNLSESGGSGIGANAVELLIPQLPFLHGSGKLMVREHEEMSLAVSRITPRRTGPTFS